MPITQTICNFGVAAPCIEHTPRCLLCRWPSGPGHQAARLNGGNTYERWDKPLLCPFQSCIAAWAELHMPVRQPHI